MIRAFVFVMIGYLALTTVGCQGGGGKNNPPDPKLEQQRQKFNLMVQDAQGRVNQFVARAKGVYEDGKRSAQQVTQGVNQQLAQANKMAEEVSAHVTQLRDVGQAAKREGEEVVEAAQAALQKMRPNPSATSGQQPSGR